MYFLKIILYEKVHKINKIENKNIYNNVHDKLTLILKTLLNEFICPPC
jgi:hypothetical protein